MYCTFLQACRWYGSFPDRLVILLDGILVYQESTLNLYYIVYTVKKVLVFPSPVGMSLTKLSLDGNNKLFPAREILVCASRLGTGKTVNFFFFSVLHFFERPLLWLGIFERCINSNPESCRSKQVCYQLSQPFSYSKSFLRIFYLTLTFNAGFQTKIYGKCCSFPDVIGYNIKCFLAFFFICNHNKRWTVGLSWHQLKIVRHIYFLPYHTKKDKISKKD